MFFSKNLSLEKPKKRTGRVSGHSRTLSRVEAMGGMVGLTDMVNLCFVYQYDTFLLSVLSSPVHFQPPKYQWQFHFGGICPVHP